VSEYRIYKVTKDEEYWQIRDFLREVWRLTNDKTLNWNIARLDYFRWHVFGNCYEKNLLDYLHICENDARIIAVLISDSPGGYMLQVHPNFYQAELFDALLQYYDTVIVPGESIKRGHIPVEIDESIMEAGFQKAGFTPGKFMEFRREADLSKVSVEYSLPEGFIIRSLGEADELPARSWASWRAFHPDESNEKYEGWEWYFNIQRCPLYKRDLDLVCIAPDGKIASFCTIWYDDYNRTGLFEPVGTNPDYWRKGLAKALIKEGFKRLKALGAEKAYVDSYEEPAHSLYENAGFKTVKIMKTWNKKYSWNHVSKRKEDSINTVLF